MQRIMTNILKYFQRNFYKLNGNPVFGQRSEDSYLYHVRQLCISYIKPLDIHDLITKYKVTTALKLFTHFSSISNEEILNHFSSNFISGYSMARVTRDQLFKLVLVS